MVTYSDIRSTKDEDSFIITINKIKKKKNFIIINAGERFRLESQLFSNYAYYYKFFASLIFTS